MQMKPLSWFKILIFILLKQYKQTYSPKVHVAGSRGQSTLVHKG